jgi:hypothetical protein
LKYIEFCAATARCTLALATIVDYACPGRNHRLTNCRRAARRERHPAPDPLAADTLEVAALNDAQGFEELAEEQAPVCWH